MVINRQETSPMQYSTRWRMSVPEVRQRVSTVARTRPLRGKDMFAAKTRRRLSLLLMTVLLIAHLTPVRAEVVLQGSSTPLPGPAITVNGNVGQTRGSNLFQSFSVFNILRPGTAASGLVVTAQ